VFKENLDKKEKGMHSTNWYMDFACSEMMLEWHEIMACQPKDSEMAVG